MAKTTITTGTTITTAETTTTITTTITITTEAPTPATETPAEVPTPATETPAEAPTPATGALPTPTEIATTTEVPAAETATAIAPATALKEMQDAHEAAVEYCVELEVEEFAELIRWAQHFDNSFPFYAVQLKDVVNADDVYKDAIVRICEPLGEEVVRKAIKLVDAKKILDLAEYLKYVKTIVEEWGDI